MEGLRFEDQDDYSAVARLLDIARNQTGGQARRVADFLLAWHNADENGKWDPRDLWGVDSAIADDMLTVLHLIRKSHKYPGDLGFTPEIEAVWRFWKT
jgi:hypothetical protein